VIGAGTLLLGGAEVPQGARTDLLLKVSESYTGDRTSIPVTVVNGDQPGPVLFVTAAIHGDELNGIGIVRDLLGRVEPGPGSLRDAADRVGVPVLTYEGGQALRFEDDVIAVGVAGVLRVMGALGMLDHAPPQGDGDVVECDETHWIRADHGGILDLHVAPGDLVMEGQPLWTVTGPFGRERSQKVSPYEGYVIGMTTLPLVNPGDAVLHIAVPGVRGAASIDEPTDEEDLLGVESGEGDEETD